MKFFIKDFFSKYVSCGFGHVCWRNTSRKTSRCSTAHFQHVFLLLGKYTIPLNLLKASMKCWDTLYVDSTNIFEQMGSITIFTNIQFF